MLSDSLHKKVSVKCLPLTTVSSDPGGQTTDIDGACRYGIPIHVFPLFSTRTTASEESGVLFGADFDQQKHTNPSSVGFKCMRKIVHLRETCHACTMCTWNHGAKRAPLSLGLFSETHWRRMVTCVMMLVVAKQSTGLHRRYHQKVPLPRYPG